MRMGCPCGVKSETAGEELNERHRGSRFGGNKGQPAWEAVTDGVDRLPIPGGWIYRTDRGVVFVPDKAQEISHMDTGAVG